MTRQQTINILPLKVILTLLVAIGVTVSPFGYSKAESILISYESGNPVVGSSIRITESRDLRSFTKIRSEIPAEILLRTGKEQSVTVTFDDNLISKISTEVSNNTLHLSTDGNFTAFKQCLVEIVVPSLIELTASGSETINIDIKDGSYLILNLDGAQQLSATGKIDALEINLMGDVDVDVRSLYAQSVMASLDGIGDISLYASESFVGEVSGWGNITYFGKPSNTQLSVSGIGQIKPGR